MTFLQEEIWEKILSAATRFRKGQLEVNDLEGKILLKVERWHANKGCSVEVPDEWVRVLRRIVGEADTGEYITSFDSPQGNRYPYEETGGTSYYQKRGWAINKPKRK